MEHVTLPRRSERFGVGWEADGGVYVHKEFARYIVPDSLLDLNDTDPFQFQVVKWDWREGCLSIYYSPWFCINNEIIYKEALRIYQNGRRQRIFEINRGEPQDAPVIFHKWLLVPDYYADFNVQAAKYRSRWLLSLPEINLAEIKTKDEWKKTINAVANRYSNWHERVINALREVYKPEPWIVISKDEVYDYIMALHAYEEEKAPQQFLRELARCITPYEIETKVAIMPPDVMKFMAQNDGRGYVLCFDHLKFMFSDQETAALFRLTFG